MGPVLMRSESIYSCRNGLLTGRFLVRFQGGAPTCVRRPSNPSSVAHAFPAFGHCSGRLGSRCTWSDSGRPDRSEFFSGGKMVTRCWIVMAALLLAARAEARIEPFPSSFRTRQITSNGTTLYVRVGGTGPAVLLLHGFGDTGDMWAPLAARLAGNHTVVVPDLRGMGLSAHPETGYEKKNQAVDMAGVLDA